jgi:enamine deaminase RidA (YjgF/YER057c/UK114 family)
MDAVETRNPPSMAAPAGLYSHLGITSGGRIAFIAGQLPFAEDGSIVGANGDIDAQVERCFQNIELALSALGVGWPQLVKMTTYVTSGGSVADFYRVRQRLFETFFPDGHYPPNTLLVVKSLIRPEFMVEIEGVAIVA